MGKETMLVMEAGSLWPSFVDRDEDATDVIVIVEHTGERPLAFAHRVFERVAALDAAPAAALLVCAEDSSPERLRVRETLLRALLARAEDTGTGVVVLVAGGTFPQQRALADLATRLAGELDDAAGVTLRFRAVSRPARREGPLSGSHWVASEHACDASPAKHRQVA
jgi:hypothetical protein